MIRLKLSAQMLEGAEISADKSFVMNNIDRKTYNTDQLAVTAGGKCLGCTAKCPQCGSRCRWHRKLTRK
ncbi:MAG: hypothetical protein IPN13_18855 [Bacteroidetes bacterium]|nr:hypothetical protein [Bacteroidota bacterium]